MITVNTNGTAISAGFISALTSDNAEYQARLLDGSTELECAITRMTITKGSCGDTNGFTIGNVVGSTLVAEVKGLATSVKGKELKAQIGVKVGSAFEYVNLGFFTVSEAPQTAYATTITAYGATITKTGDAFTVPASQTLANIASSIASTASALAGRTITVSFGSGITTSDTITASMNNLTAYQALQILASCVGGYAIDTYDGNIKICRFSDTATLSRDTSTMRNLPLVDEDNFEINGVLCKVKEASEDEEGQVVPAVQFPTTPTGNENLILLNPYMTQSLYTSYLATLAGYEYRPATIGLTYGDPRLEGNDVLSITDINSNVYTVPCHLITHKFDGGFTSQIISATATPQENEVATSAGNLTEQLSSISASTISARASAETAKAYAEEAKQTTDEINAYAETAGKTVTQILADGETASAKAQQAIQDAGTAKTMAQSATVSANSALTQLDVVEDVIGTLNWITQHATYKASSDTTVVAGKYYFTKSGDNYTIVTNPTGNPSTNGYYEIDTIDEAVSNYVSSHLVLDSNGLWVVNDNSSYKILLSSTGMVVYDDQGNAVSTFGESIEFASTRSQFIGGTDAHIEFDSMSGTITIGGTKVTMVSPQSVFTWDMELSVDERETLNENIGLSEDTSTWIYNDITSAEMETLNAELGLSESTASWDNSVTVDEYKQLCNAVEIGYQFGKSVYVGMDAISLGDDFFVDDDGYLISTSGRIGGWDIEEHRLSHGTAGSSDYIELSGNTGIKLGKYFSITPNGYITARRGMFAGFTLVPVENGLDYMVSDYTINGVTWRTWIRSAQTTDVGNTWAFSSQYMKSGDAGFYGAFVAQSNGEIMSRPVDNNGNMRGHQFGVNATGVYIYPNKTVTSQPNLHWNTTNHCFEYTTWSASSEKIKRDIKKIERKELQPENLYDVEIVQFKYSNDIVDKTDRRYNTDLVGFIIEDLEKKYPIAVDKEDENDTKTWSWNSVFMIPSMLKLIQDQHKEIEQLKERQNTLEKQIAEMQKGSTK